MNHGKVKLDGLLEKLPDGEQIRFRLDSLVFVYPFNEYEYIISHLLAKDVLSLDQYLELRDNYIARNMYLYIFQISAARTFGEAWAQGHLKELVPELQKSTKKLGPNYSGQYDFLLNRKIRIEVKASRAVCGSTALRQCPVVQLKQAFLDKFQANQTSLLRCNYIDRRLAGCDSLLGSYLA
jgi:hypothetical protein